MLMVPSGRSYGLATLLALPRGWERVGREVERERRGREEGGGKG
jgi:hypothetical protein